MMETYRDFAMEAGFLGLTYAEQGEALGCGKGYAGDLWNGRKPLTAPIEAKLRAIIADKANGPVESKHVLELVEIKEMAVGTGSFTIPDNGVARFDEPVDLSDYSGSDRFAVIDAQDGTAVLVEIIEPFRNHTAARKICRLLNKEAG